MSKILLKIFLAILLLTTFLIISLLAYLFYPYATGNMKQEYSVSNISKDTTFRWDRYGAFINAIKRSPVSFGVQFTIRAKGNIDDSAKVHFQYVGHPENSSYSCILPKGKVDTVFYGEIYTDECEVVYSHGNVKNGNLAVSFELGHHRK